jgi:hypothetical protein
MEIYFRMSRRKTEMAAYARNRRFKNMRCGLIKVAVRLFSANVLKLIKYENNTVKRTEVHFYSDIEVS